MRNSRRQGWTWALIACAWLGWAARPGAAQADAPPALAEQVAASGITTDDAQAWDHLVRGYFLGRDQWLCATQRVHTARFLVAEGLAETGLLQTAERDYAVEATAYEAGRTELKSFTTNLAARYPTGPFAERLEELKRKSTGHEVTGEDIFFLVFDVLGGLALFIFGMNVMTTGLRSAAGAKLRIVLAKTGGNKLAGILTGTTLGFLVHSSATTVMLVGFVNAGLMGLAQTIPPILGANIGTTLSMQMISFKLDAYCYVAVVLGFLLSMAAPGQRAKDIGSAILGFGLLFLGMRVMGDSIKPYGADFAPILAGINGNTMGGLVLGVLISTAITGVIQSSGAMVGMCYALINAGVFTDLSQAYPIILGAHIGTCATALLACIGTNINARRCAVAHLMFNVLNAILFIFLAPITMKVVVMTTGDLVHQAANMHTIVQTAGALLFLPFSAIYARFIELIVPSFKPPPQPSFLDPELQEKPETALSACLLECRRMTDLCARSLRMASEIFNIRKPKMIRDLLLNEDIVDEIKKAMNRYLKSLTKRYLSHRQALMIQYLDGCMIDIERIHDHIERMAEITIIRLKTPEGRFDRELLEHIFDLLLLLTISLRQLMESFDPAMENRGEAVAKILTTYDNYIQQSNQFKQVLSDRTVHRGVGITPISSLYCYEYIGEMSRIIKHVRAIAMVERQPEFLIKKKKLDKAVDEAPPMPLPEIINMEQFVADHLRDDGPDPAAPPSK